MQMPLSPEALLDCSSVATALRSVGRIIEWDEERVRESLLGFSIDWDDDVAPEDQVLRHLGYATIDRVPAPQAIRWFHASRALSGTTFRDGLLPTMAVLPQLWSTLWQFASVWISEQDWIRYQTEFHTANRQFAAQFRSKRILGPLLWQGPCAFLVRDAATSKVGRHIDFTAMPECLADICADFEQVFGQPLRDAYRAGTQPCLVTFTRPGDWHGAMRAAINYIYRTLHGIAHDRYCNTNFDGRGVAVPPGWIDGVEWL